MKYANDSGLYADNNSDEEVFVFPASYAQQRLWFLDQFDPGSPFYNIPYALRIKGKFNIPILKRAVEEIARRHESLRTTFSTMEGKPVQIISQNVNIPFSVVDLANYSEEAKEPEINRLVKENARYSFNLSKGPLIRITVLNTDAEECVLVLVMHHIISDGWSMAVLVEEITKLYSAFSLGISSPLPGLEIQYADYSQWQKEFLQGETLEKQMSYWKNRLGDHPPYLELPTDRPRPAIWTNNGSSASRMIPKRILDEINSLSRNEGVTLFMTLIAAFYVLLYKYTGQTDISLGTPIANRTRKEVENLIGLFINTIVIRTELDGNPAFRELLQRVKKVTLEGYENQDLPFEFIVEKLQPERDMSYQPLFQVMFILQNIPVNSQPLREVEMSMIDVDMGTSTFDITLNLAETYKGLSASIEYNTDLFNRSTIEQMLQHYENLLNNIILSPGSAISSLQIMDEYEINRIVNEWNNSRLLYENCRCIHKLFERQVALCPDSIAAVYEEKSITYRELNERSNQLARKLKKLGMAPENIAAICIERSLEMLISVLGVLKSGGAYLPLDASYPEERLRFMIEDANVKVLITQSHLVNLISSFNGPVVLLDRHAEEIAAESPLNLVNETSEDNLVYVIYTSGSTGRPKGTMITHKSLINAFKAWENSYELNTRARNHLQMASFSFDVFAGDWTRALCSGGKLVIAPREILLEGEKLYALMKKEDVNIAEFVPAVLRSLVQYLEESGNKLDFFHLLIAGSDIWYAGEYKKFRKFCGKDTRLINSFGLTEATIDSSFFETDDLNIPNERLVPIGRPFANMTLYILDEFLNPVTAGVRGELFVGGWGLARGYLGRADITAEKYIPNPFAKDPGERLYRTGDLARYLSDGNIEFLGRKDNQIKLRGLRVELGEIETALSEIENIKDAAVIAREDTPGDKRIAAYLVPREGNTLNVSEIKQSLSGRLPEYMIPYAFVFLPKLPVTSNGKIDRRALPAPDINEIMKELKSNYAPPRTAVEEVIAAIWSDILKIQKVGINDNFFELGGHSLLATQVISRIKSTFKLEIPLRSIFENPTVSRLSHIVEAEEMNKKGLWNAAILPAPPEENVPLSFSQQRLWFLDQLEPGNTFYNIPETYKIKGRLNIAILEAGFNELIKRHEILRTSFLTIDGKPKVEISPELKIKINVTDLSEFTGDELDRIIESISRREVQNYIPLNEAPLFRISVLKLSDEDFIILVVFHHIVTDEWSSVIMIKEIALIYNDLMSNICISLPELKIQYKDYSVWQRKYLSGDNLNTQIEYWKDKLRDIPACLELPLDHPRPAVQSFRGDYISCELSSQMVKCLREFNRVHSLTMFMTMLSAFQALLFRLSGQDDIVIGTPVANRNKEEIEPLIGFFVNTVVLRSKINKGMRFLDLTKDTMESSLEAFTFQDLPFEMLVDAIQPERSLSRSPIFQVMFTLQNAPRRDYELNSELRIIPYEVHSMTSKFDLTMFVSEISDEKVSVALEYNADLFEKESAEKMLRLYKCILEHVMADNNMEVSRIPLLSRQEERLVIDKLTNSHHGLIVLDEAVHEVFEKVALKVKDRTALVYKEKHMTFQELNTRSNKLAHYLIRKGIGPENVVGIALNRSFEMIVSLLAVLKAGGCYLPLDTNYPKERLNYIVDDSALRILVTNKELSQKVYAEKAETIFIDEAWEEIEKESDKNPEIRADLDNLAYIIYTSGSTGKPKGTMITHRNLANYLSWCISAYPFEENIGAVFHLSIAFDAAVTSIYPALLSGRSVKIIPEDTDIYLLGNELAGKGNAGTVKITPAHMDILAGQYFSNQKIFAQNENKLNIRAFVAGGENLTFRQVSFYQQNCPDTLIYNEYGPTEATVGCIVFEASKYKGEGSVPIGRVIPGVYVYILDENLNLTGENIPGELYIGGLGLSRGYLSKADTTAEKFIPDPFSMVPGMRLYKTGDKVKLLKDGNIEFLGRLDEQFKIHGYRIEPGEIEAALRQHKGIKDVLVIKHNGKEEKLAAYCIPENEHLPNVKELREHLKKIVPAYMVPQVFMFIDKFHLTVNGKIDRKKLPEPKVDLTESSKSYIPPVTDKELQLTRIWQDVLNIGNIGITDNFFELGGDSIVSIQVIARANQAGFSLTPKDVFQHPTIKDLAAVSNNNRLIKAEQGIVTGEIPLTPVQHWFFEQKLYNTHHNNQSVLFEVGDALKPEPLETAVKELLRHHDALRIYFHNDNGKWDQFNRDIIENTPLTIVDMSELPEEDIPGRIEYLSAEYQAGLNIEKELLKVIYFDAGTGRTNRLLIIVHHLVMDAVSWRILLEDFQTAYQQATLERKITLPFKTTSFMDWAKRLQEYAQSPDILKEYSYWQKIKDKNIIPVHVDYPSGENLERYSRVVQFSLSEDDTKSLLKYVPAILHSEILHALVAALVRAFGRTSGKNEMLLEMESHGRSDNFNDMDVSRTIGWFTGIYPVCLNLEGSIDIKDSVKKVKEQISNVPNNGIGFGVLKYLSADDNIKAGMNSLPRPEISFNYLGQFEQNTPDNSSISQVTISKGPERDPNNKRPYLIEITSAVTNGRLNIEWVYSEKLFSEAAMRTLADSYIEEIREIVRIVNTQEIDLKAKDYSEFGWDQQEVDKILSVISGAKE